MHQLHFAIFDKKISQEDIYEHAHEVLADDLLHEDEPEKTTHIMAYGDWLSLGGRFIGVLTDPKSKEFKNIQNHDAIIEAMYGKNKLPQIIQAREILNNKFACRRLDRKTWKRLHATQFVKDWISEETCFFDYVNMKITEFCDLEFDKIKGHWIVIIDLHS